MATAELLEVEVAYATPAQQYLLSVSVPYGSTVEQAIQQSGICEQCSDIDLSAQSVGIFSKLATLQTVLNHGDRVEIYRPLLVDPKLQRKERAQRQEKDHR